MKYTLKFFRKLKKEGSAIDISNGDNSTRKAILEREGFLRHIGYSRGINGCNGLLLEGETTNTKYVIIGRTSALWIFS